MIEEIQRRDKIINIVVNIIAKSLKFFLVIPLLIMLVMYFISPVSYLAAMGIQLLINLTFYIIKLYRNDNTSTRLTNRV